MRTKLLVFTTMMVLLSSSFGLALGSSYFPEGRMQYQDVDRPSDDDRSCNIKSSSGFLENIGQVSDDEVRYYLNTGSGRICFLDSGLIYNVESTRGTIGREAYLDRLLEDGPHRSEGQGTTVNGCNVRFTYIGANDVMAHGRDPVDGVSNFFYGQDPSRWLSGARRFSEVVYPGLYDGIDLVYRTVGDDVKYEFIADPGADVSQISVGVEGHQYLRVSSDGDLIISTSMGDVIDSGLLAYYQDSRTEMIPCSFRIRSDEIYSFSLEQYDASRTIVIDPIVYSTFLGGSDQDHCYCIDIDDSSNVYVSGWSRSDDFPTTAGAYQRRLANESGDIFVTKLKANLSALVYSTYIGGLRTDESNDIHVDSDGNLYVAGLTYSLDFPTTPNALQRSWGGAAPDGFVLKLNKTGGDLLYSTYIGSDWDDEIWGLAVDDSGCAHVTGCTHTPNFTTTKGALFETFQGYFDAFVCKLNPTGSAFVYSTFLGGSKSDAGMGIQVDDQGCAYIFGRTSTNFPVTNGAYQTLPAGGNDAFITKLNPNGSAMVYSTYLGGNAQEAVWYLGGTIALDHLGQVHVTSFTKSGDFPTTSGAYQRVHKGDWDIYVSCLDKNGSSLVASTLVGRSKEDRGYGIAVDGDLNVYVTGWTLSTDFPTTKGAESTTYDRMEDGILFKLDKDYSNLTYSTFINGNNDDYGYAVHINDEVAVVVGTTCSPTFTTTNGAYQEKGASRGDYEAFITIYTFDVVFPIAVAGPDVGIPQHETVRFNGSLSSDNKGIVNWTWNFTYNSSEILLFGPVVDFTFHSAGIYNVTLTVRDGGYLEATDWLFVTVIDITPPDADAGMDMTVDQNTSVHFDGSGSSDNVEIVNWTWRFRYNDDDIVLFGPDPSFTFYDIGEYLVELNVSDTVGNSAVDEMVVTVRDSIDPTANAGTDIEVGLGDLVTFDGSSSTDNVEIVNWTWRFQYRDEDVLLHGSTASFTFDKLGSYQVTLTVLDSAGNWGTDTLIVSVVDRSSPVADAGDDRTIDQGTVLELDGSGSTDNVGIYLAAWTFEYEGEPVELIGLKTQFLFESAGAYHVYLNVSDAAGNWDVDGFWLTVNDIEEPVARTGGIITIEQHGQASFDGSASTDNVGVVSWNWSFEVGGETIVLDGESRSYTFDEAGTFLVHLTVADEAGNTDMAVLEVIVIDITNPVAVAGDDLIVDQQEEFVLDGSGSSDNVGIVRWLWTVTHGDYETQYNGKVNSLTREDVGVYTVSLMVFDEAGNTDTSEMSVTVRDSTSPVAAPQKDRSVRVNEDISFDASASTDNIGIVSWKWTIDDGDEAVDLEGEVVSYRFDKPGTYMVMLTVSDGEGNTDMETFEVTVKDVEDDHAPSYILGMMAIVVVLLLAILIILFIVKRRTQ